MRFPLPRRLHRPPPPPRRRAVPESASGGHHNAARTRRLGGVRSSDSPGGRSGSVRSRGALPPGFPEPSGARIPTQADSLAPGFLFGGCRRARRGPTGLRRGAALDPGHLRTPPRTTRGLPGCSRHGARAAEPWTVLAISVHRPSPVRSDPAPWRVLGRIAADPEAGRARPGVRGLCRGLVESQLGHLAVWLWTRGFAFLTQFPCHYCGIPIPTLMEY